jgi:hypothetical protein
MSVVDAPQVYSIDSGNCQFPHPCHHQTIPNNKDVENPSRARYLTLSIWPAQEPAGLRTSEIYKYGNGPICHPAVKWRLRRWHSLMLPTQFKVALSVEPKLMLLCTQREKHQVLIVVFCRIAIQSNL